MLISVCVFIDCVGVPDILHHDWTEEPAAQEESPQRGEEEDGVIPCVYGDVTEDAIGSAPGTGTWERHIPQAGGPKTKGPHAAYCGLVPEL